MRREEESGGHRHARLEGLLLEELSALLRDDVSDPALADAQVTALVLSIDYRHARVHFVIRGAAGESASKRGAVERALARATPFLRAQIASSIDLKRVPDLRFVFDGMAANDEPGEPWK